MWSGSGVLIESKETSIKTEEDVVHYLRLLMSCIIPEAERDKKFSYG